MSANTKARKDLKQCYEEASKSLMSYMQDESVTMSSADDSRQLSRQSSHRQGEDMTSTDNSCTVSRQSSVRQGEERVKPKLVRRVSFTEKDPVIIPGAKEGTSGTEQAEEPRKPRRVKKSGSGDKEKKRRSKREKSTEPLSLAPAAAADRRKSQPLGDELFEQVREQLKLNKRNGNTYLYFIKK